jgi:hypothetical protein
MTTIKTGVLTSTEARDLSRDLHYESWSEWADQDYPDHPDGTQSFLSNGRQVVVFGVTGSDVLVSVIGSVEDWASRLHKQGEPYRGPVRISLRDYSDPMFRPRWAVAGALWPLASPPSEFVGISEKPFEPLRTFFFPIGSDADALRGLRKIAGSCEPVKDPSKPSVRTDADFEYCMFMRDVSPVETADGQRIQLTW